MLASQIVHGKFKGPADDVDDEGENPTPGTDWLGQVLKTVDTVPKYMTIFAQRSGAYDMGDQADQWNAEPHAGKHRPG